MAELGFKVDTNAPEESFDALPAGIYTVIISESEYKSNKNNNGMILVLVYEIIQEGSFKGRKIYENLNLQNPNEQAVTISRKALNSIGMAVGVLDIKDSAQLHGIPLKLDIGYKPPQKDDSGNVIKEAENKIKKHLSCKDAPKTEAAAQSAPATGETEINTGSEKKAWEK